MTLRLSLFDWNGTLLNDQLIAYLPVAEIFRRYGLEPPPPEEYWDEIGHDYMKFYEDRGIHATADELNAIRTPFLRDNPSMPDLHPNAREVVELARNLGMRTGIVSGEHEDLLFPALQRLGLANPPLFDRIEAHAQDKKAVMIALCKEFGVLPAEAYYVDDTKFGLLAAKEAGLISIGVTCGWASRKKIKLADPHHTCDSLAEVMEIFKKEVPNGSNEKE